jgi:2,3-bisphosphoglycerate-dependent phosphoglycerate mutase
MAYLALIRHGKSEYNEKGIWTGWDNPSLIESGKEDAMRAAKDIHDLKFDSIYSSPLLRVTQTRDIIKKELGLEQIPTIENEALNERHYGDFTGKNKWQVKDSVGEEEFQKIRRSWDYPIPNGESMKQVFDRIVPYYHSEIEPLLKSGKNILIVSSGNSLRALVKELDGLDENQISELEFGIGEVYLYTIDTDGNVTNKEIRNKNPLAGKI